MAVRETLRSGAWQVVVCMLEDTIMYLLTEKDCIWEYYMLVGKATNEETLHSV